MDYEDLADTQSKRRAIVISAAIAVLTPLLYMLASVFDMDVEFFLGRRNAGWRVEIPRAVGLPLMAGGIGAMIAVVMLATKAYLFKPGTSESDSVSTKLLPGELVRWSGRPGWRSFRGPRAIGTLLVFGIPGLLAWWVWATLSGTGPLSIRLFFAMLPWTLLFGSVIPGLISGSGVLYDWLRDVFGSVAITERRIVWLSPWRRRIYREIAGPEIVDAYIMGSGRRGSMTVIRRNGGDVENVYLDGLPRPDAALAAVTPLVKYLPGETARSQ